MTATSTSTAAGSGQADRLRALAGEQLAAAVASPYYREVLGPDAAGGEVPLAELPTLPKATLMDNFDRIVTDPRLRRDAVEAHLAGADPGRPFLGRYRVFATAGTTGLRGLFVYSDEEFASWIAACLRGLACWGLTAATRLAGIGSPSPLHISQQLYATLLAGRPATAPRVTVTTPLPELVAALNTYRPEALTAYPSIAAQLAEAQLHGRLRISPSLVATTSEVLTADMRHRIREAWSLDPVDFYGTTEAAVVAASRPSQTGMDILEDLVIVEVVDRHNHPVSPGQPGHKVLLTNLVNHTQPLIRYELTDSVTLSEGPNPLGLPYARIAAVDGRSDDIITLEASGGGQVAIHPFRLRAPFAQLPDVRQYQIRHDHTGLHVRLVLRPSAPRDTLQRIQAALTNELQAAGAVAPPIEVTQVPELPRDQGHGAKLKLIETTQTTAR